MYPKRSKKYHQVMVKYRHKWSCSKTLSILSQVQHSGSDALVTNYLLMTTTKQIKPLTQGNINKTKLSTEENLRKTFPT